MKRKDRLKTEILTAAEGRKSLLKRLFLLLKRKLLILKFLPDILLYRIRVCSHKFHVKHGDIPFKTCFTYLV